MGVGAALGIGISLIVNLALVELSVSPFFSFYFGILFVAVGCVILWRIISQDITDSAHLRKIHLSIFAGIIVFSGFLCPPRPQHLRRPGLRLEGPALHVPGR